MVTCPNCDAVIDIEEDELDEGDEFTCEECSAELAITNKDPLEVEVLSEAEDEEDDEDFDEDEDDDEDEEELDEEEEDESWR